MAAQWDAPLEADCQRAIVDAARHFGYLVHHQRPGLTAAGRIINNIQGDKGFPDLVIVGHGRCLIVELKRRPNKPSKDQVAWLAALTAAGADARVVIVPEQQQALIDELHQIAINTRRTR